MTTPPAGNGPTVRRILLGSQLRRLREAKGVTREQAGYHIRGSESKISRLELGRVSFKERDVEDLLTLYGVTDEVERAPFLALVREANQQGWWQSYSDVLPNWFQPYIGLEESATLIRSYELQFIPGLLQTEDYARAVITQGNRGVAKDVIEARVAVRMNRQKVLTRENAPRLWVVIDEAALRRPIGGAKTMKAQLEHLVELMSTPSLTLQVMPFDFGGHSAEGGAFSILRFPESDIPDVVYIEVLGGAHYLDRREDVDRYMEAMDRLCVDSTTPARTADVLRKIASSL
ncbi:helix-turn-helix domain-containing protein [Frankia sp. CNm7]|uniref:Helix-turn-helix domain-containing protein n=1 Tax=Frankia nepalensis TaxID=1836974 RepID=A0A937RII3_9ACTN|nr:helix-turn-helix transcriptional regulator [Frankia nepalensis]MBL7497734.1 helix-turn-helix domain-containing protein [Frankia nepalensis]MBL7509737.1 helix-turn-helix domain-containing protein [Frankia nepalensis]MBL7516915.1 helix-turn-helix domain-containing protein [Frankia nepalensis]MBL7629464.1 helix-turn-helix domain-containing protein [Frankia nepalensis]